MSSVSFSSIMYLIDHVLLERGVIDQIRMRDDEPLLPRTMEGTVECLVAQEIGASALEGWEND